MKKILLIISGILILPIKSFAAETTANMTYHILEPSAFSSFGLNSTDAPNLPSFLSAAFQFGLAIAAALAVIMIVWGGVEIMLSESVFKKDDGKKKIQDAIWGLLLALVSWLILFTINPDILKFKI